MSVVEIVDHPLIQHKISLMRDRNTGTKEFRDLVSEIAMLLCYEATRDLPTEEVEVETPVALARTKVLAGRKLALVPILRAGLGMVDGMLNLIPAAKVGHIGMYRNEETLEPVEYYCKLPNDIAERDIILLDPMLATGGSSSAAPAYTVTGAETYETSVVDGRYIIAVPSEDAALNAVLGDLRAIKAQGADVVVFRTRSRESSLVIDEMLAMGPDATPFVLTHNGSEARLTINGAVHNELIH